MHPSWYRSTTIFIIDKDVLKKSKRRARDPEIGENYLVSADTSHKDWFSDQEEKHGADKLNVFQKKTQNRNADKK
ncbi:MAG: hypothetical protein RSB19_06065 [Erysipelotrichaceae bacterium]